MITHRFIGFHLNDTHGVYAGVNRVDYHWYGRNPAEALLVRPNGFGPPGSALTGDSAGTESDPDRKSRLIFDKTRVAAPDFASRPS